MWTAQSAHFLDQGDFNQYSLALDDLADQLPYLTEDLEGARALIYNDQCVAVEIPTAVALAITQCDPGVKGNSATARTKPVTLETGLVVQAPEYLKEGETIKVDTRTGEFSRVRDVATGIRDRLLGLFRDDLRDCVFFRELTDVELRVDSLAVDVDFEAPTVGGDKLKSRDLRLELGKECGRQTDGLRFVVSHRAVFETNLHWIGPHFE